jgi:hypothetical protein
VLASQAESRGFESHHPLCFSNELLPPTIPGRWIIVGFLCPQTQEWLNAQGKKEG